MAHARRSVTVERPIAEVFAFVADGTKDPLWRPDVISIRLVSGPGSASGVGAQYEQTMKGPGGRPIRGDFRVTRYDEPSRFEFDVTAGPARPHGSFELRALSPGSTEVTFTLDLEPRGLLRLMGSMLAKQVETEVANLENLPAAIAR